MDPRVTRAIRRLEEALWGREEVVTAYLFGSAADRSAHREPQDLDVAVVFIDSVVDPFREALHLQVMAERAAGFPVDLQAFDAMPVDVRFRVIDTGQVLVERDPICRIRSEARVMLEYYDFKPYLDRIRKAALARARRAADADE
jgi:predicted nucleotidyltransferase